MNTQPLPPPPPNRRPTAHDTFENSPNRESPFWYQTSYDRWPATATEPGQARHRLLSWNDYDAIALASSYAADVDTLANAGMKEVYDVVGVRTYRTFEQIGSDGLGRHELILTWDNVRNVVQHTNEMTASSSRRGAHFLLRVTSTGFFAAELAVGHGAEGELLMATESPSDEHDRAWHDAVLHLLGWLCMPPTVTSGAHQLLRDAKANYEWAVTLPVDDPHKTFLIEFAREAMGELLDSLEVINLHTIACLVRDESDGVVDKLSTLLGLPRPALKDDILSHIRNPRLENILRIT